MRKSEKLLLLRPALKDMLWGGTRLSEFGYNLPSGTVGECWGISAHPRGDCIVKAGPYKGMPLSRLYEEHRELFGPVNSDRFPLLVKIIDAKQDLSVQVHPDDEYAREHENGSLGKTECWYVLDAAEDATIIIGHHAKTKAEAERMVREGRFSEFLREIPVHKGDFFLIEPGVVHSIKAGTLILETQENSDITYRFYDYDRVRNGVKRELHIDKSLDVITCPFRKTELHPVITRIGSSEIETLASIPDFTVDRITVDGSVGLDSGVTFVNLSVTDGEGTVDGVPIRKGSHLIVPYGYGEYVLSGKMEVFRSTVPCKYENPVR